MNNDRKKEYKVGLRKLTSAIDAVKSLRSIVSTAVPKAYYNQIKSKRAVTKNHPVWEGLNDLLIIKGGRVCIR